MIPSGKTFKEKREEEDKLLWPKSTMNSGGKEKRAKDRKGKGREGKEREKGREECQKKKKCK